MVSIRQRNCNIKRCIVGVANTGSDTTSALLAVILDVTCCFNSWRPHGRTANKDTAQNTDDPNKHFVLVLGVSGLCYAVVTGQIVRWLTSK